MKKNFFRSFVFSFLFLSKNSLAIFLLFISFFPQKSDIPRPVPEGIEINILGTNTNIPGVAVFHRKHWRFFTAAHWFQKGRINKYELHFQGKNFSVEKITYPGNDIAEIFIGESRWIYGEAPYSQRSIFKGKIIDRPIPMRALWIIGDNKYKGKFSTYKKFCVHAPKIEQWYFGVVISTSKNTLGKGDSGTPFIDSEGRIYLLSASVSFKDFDTHILVELNLDQ